MTRGFKLKGSKFERLEKEVQKQSKRVHFLPPGRNPGSTKGGLAKRLLLLILS